MNNKRATKRALLTSVMALVMCVVMLVGTTFAWFTDTASTGVNKIQAGNLDITVEYAKEKMNDDGTLAGVLTDWKPIDNATNVFDPNALWEPGRTEYVVFKITNNGNLALKYKLSLETLAQKPGINKAGEKFYLADYLCASAKVNPNVIGSGKSGIGDFMTKLNDLGSAGVQNVFDPEYHPLTDATVNGTLLPGKTNCVPMAIWMPTSVGNEANAIDSENAATIDFGITVVATQDTVENDSFGNEYDEDATYPVMSNEGLKDAINGATGGNTVVVASGEYTLSDSETTKTEIPAGVTIAGAGRDKTTLNVSNDKISKGDVTLKDMTIKGSGSAGTGGTLNINGNNTTIENVDYKGDGNIAITVSTGAGNTGTTFRGTKITNAFRGIQFWSLSGDSVIDNCVLDVAGYTFNIDAAVADSTLTITDSTLNGWTSYTSGIKLVTFERCKLGLNAFQYLRPYSETKLVNCDFTSGGYQLNAGGSDDYTITLTDCTKNGMPITAENVKTLLLHMEDWNTNATLIVNGVTVTV